MSKPALKLVKNDFDELDPIPLERRSSTRHAVSGRVTTLSELGEKEEAHKKISALQLVDISDFGLGAIASEPVIIGGIMTVFFPPHGADSGFNAQGRVVRCVKRDYGYEVGLRFAARCAA